MYIKSYQYAYWSYCRPRFNIPSFLLLKMYAARLLDGWATRRCGVDWNQKVPVLWWLGWKTPYMSQVMWKKMRRLVEHDDDDDDGNGYKSVVLLAAACHPFWNPKATYYILFLVQLLFQLCSCYVLVVQLILFGEKQHIVIWWDGSIKDDIP